MKIIAKLRHYFRARVMRKTKYNYTANALLADMYKDLKR